jgi:7-cyano-7-deazaguanine reductase
MTTPDLSKLTILGNKQTEPTDKLETFEAPINVKTVTFKTDEFTAKCPLTAQPDFYHLELRYQPNKKCLESKSLKLYLWTFRDRGIFVESLASELVEKFYQVLDPIWVEVTLKQTPRGGLELEATASKSTELRLA